MRGGAKRRGIAFAVGVGVMIVCACSARPLPTQRQPEEAWRVQARLIAIAALDAYAERDDVRFRAYVAPSFCAATAASTPPDAALYAWLLARLGTPEKERAALKAWLTTLVPSSQSRYDLEQAGALPALKAPCALGRRDILVRMPAPRADAEELRLILTPTPQGYALRAAF